MTASQLALHLLTITSTLTRFDAYMFGSTLTGVGADIDILIVAPANDALIKLKRELCSASESLPLHIIYMLPSEERHYDFIAKAKCISLQELGVLSK
jgi:hypothetical protein